MAIAVSYSVPYGHHSSYIILYELRISYGVLYIFLCDHGSFLQCSMVATAVLAVLCSIVTITVAYGVPYVHRSFQRCFFVTNCVSYGVPMWTPQFPIMFHCRHRSFLWCSVVAIEVSYCVPYSYRSFLQCSFLPIAVFCCVPFGHLSFLQFSIWPSQSPTLFHMNITFPMVYYMAIAVSNSIPL